MYEDISKKFPTGICLKTNTEMVNWETAGLYSVKQADHK